MQEEGAGRCVSIYIKELTTTNIAPTTSLLIRIQGLAIFTVITDVVLPGGHINCGVPRDSLPSLTNYLRNSRPTRKWLGARSILVYEIVIHSGLYASIIRYVLYKYYIDDISQEVNVAKNVVWLSWHNTNNNQTNMNSYNVYSFAINIARD